MGGQHTASAKTRESSIAVVGLVLAVLATFYPALSGGFIWDDHAYLLSQPEARSFSWSSVRWAFSFDAAVAGHYHPLTWLSWMLDFAVAGGPDPFVFHATNLILHAGHCVLLWFLFRALLRAIGVETTDWTLLIALLLYAVHPLRVESVAWITERRDLLCGIFYAATLLAYLRSREADDSKGWMAIAFLFFVCCGLSKAWVVSLLPVIWVIDALLLRRLAPIHDVRAQLAWLKQRWPMVVATAIFLISGLMAAHRSGAMVGLEDLGLGVRLQHAVFAWWYYPLKSLWPAAVAPYYGWAGFDAEGVRAVVASIGFVLVWLFAFLVRARMLWPLALLLSYTVIVLPVLGLVQSGPQLVADRYTYIAVLPFHFALAALFGKQLAVVNRQVADGAGILLLVLVTFLGLSAYRLNDVFRDEMAFWTRVIEVSPGDITARHNRAKLAWGEGRHEMAVADLQAANQSRPESAESLITLIDLHIAMREFDKAQQLAEEARERGLPEGQRRLMASKIAAAQGDAETAHAALSDAARLTADNAALWLALARSHGARGEPEEAMTAVASALVLAPSDPDIRLEQVVHLAALGRAQEALGELQRALAVAPADWPSRGQALAWQAQIEAALQSVEPVD